jgi:hypothetical protein
MEHTNDLLSAMGERTGGHGLKLFVSIDAVIVLAGSVLTSYVVRIANWRVLRPLAATGGSNLLKLVVTAWQYVVACSYTELLSVTCDGVTRAT